MNTSLLNHCFGMEHQKVITTQYKRGGIFVKVKTKEKKLQCSICKSFRVIKSGVITREFTGVPIGSKSTVISMDIQRLKCKDCHKTRQEHLIFADPKKTYTRIFERYVIALSKFGTIKDVANHLGISWDMVKEIQKQYLKNNYSRPILKGTRYIAIDEFAFKKGHKYMTVVLNLETGIILHVGDGKGKESLEPFWNRVKRNKLKIEAVAIDMSPAFISAVTNNLPNVPVVYDHFHVVKLMNDTLSKLRRLLHNQETILHKKKLLKGTRWLLLKNNENLNEETNEEEKLQDALDVNKPLAIAYYLKEELKLLWMQNSKKNAEQFLGKWVAKAKASKIPLLMKFANSLLAYRSGIFNWYDHPISTGPLEGINNKIKTMKRQAYGYRDIDFFKMKIYSLHEKNYALVG